MENNQEKITVFVKSFPGGLLGDTIGYDMQINDESATLADFVSALNFFANENIADCRGCDGCCKERAPITSLDIALLAELLPANPYPAHGVCEAFADIYIDKLGAIDITLKRQRGGCCDFLDIPGKFCTAHTHRPFVCRSHFCLPKSNKIQYLRQEVVNHGENELVRLLLAEEANGAKPIGGKTLLEQIDPTDYPATPLCGLTDYKQLIIKNIVPAELWHKLTEK